ncbi:unnamed protein product [Rotaria sordida]|uniref:Uncharacterized protein n=1 Tax=Rotaria sordida TaxID=392033 RepID=A0A814WT96_9BILA|nr:unnamed protein product [Rotaria sordida]CAF1205940.1 unnamed protein product [Rotaria sordida]CAF3869714.1 unnamed protein product [Rotaria sordida]CAF3966174.1 unnamed protein product [Rotaria sordida]
MPREQVEWFTKQQSLHDNDKIHTHQYCTYCSIININKTNNPYSSSYEQEQIWTLARTKSNHHKRYQSSIENIHLTIPSITNMIKSYSSNTNYNDYDNEKIKLDRSISLLPPLPPSRQLSTNHFNRMNTDFKITQQQQILTSNYSNSKGKSIIKKSQPIENLMHIMHINGEFIVRI